MKLSLIKKIHWNGDACIGLACDDLKKDLRLVADIDVVSDYFCKVESGAISVGTIENLKYVELVKEYFDHMPTEWEEYGVAIAADRIVVIGVDKRAAMWGVYSLSKKLGVLPGIRFTESIPAKCEELQEEVYWDRPSSYKFRGWFLNDEDLLTQWHMGGGERDIDYKHYHVLTDVSSLEPVVETALRMGINLMIPASLLDIDDPRQEKLVAYCQSRGMYVSQHHIEPLGVSHWNYKAYYEKQNKECPFSFITERERALEVWRHYTKKWAKYGNDVIWQLGLRGKGDRPVWADDKSERSQAQWGGLISEAMQTQYDIVKEQVGDDFYSTTTLWMEGARLYADGYLHYPEKTIVVFADAGTAQMFSSDFYTVPRGGRDFGVYYHNAFWIDGPHLAVGTNTKKMLYNYDEALKKGDNAYSILNVSNVREVIMSVAANSEIVWDRDRFDVEAFHEKWCKDYYGNGAIGKMIDTYFDCFAVCDKKYLERMPFDYYYVEKGFPFAPANDGTMRYLGLRALRKEQFTEWIPRLEEAIRKFADFSDALDKAEGNAYLAWFAFQPKYLGWLATWTLSCIKYNETGDAKELAAGIKAIKDYMEGRKAFATGIFENWYRGDTKMNFENILTVTESIYRGDGIPEDIAKKIDCFEPVRKESQLAQATTNVGSK